MVKKKKNPVCLQLKLYRAALGHSLLFNTAVGRPRERTRMWRNWFCQVASGVAVPFHTSIRTDTDRLFGDGLPAGARASHYAFVRIFLMGRGAQRLFTGLFAIRVSSLVKHLCNSWAHLFISWAVCLIAEL